MKKLFFGRFLCCTSAVIYHPPRAFWLWAGRRWNWGADTFQFFTRNPRGSKAKELDPTDAAALAALMKDHCFAPIIAHAPYTLNLCGAEEKNRLFARDTMADDLRRMEHIPGQLYNFHPGSHVGQGTEAGITYIAEGLNAILTPEQSTTVLLETMAGKGSEVGGRFEGATGNSGPGGTDGEDRRLSGHLPRFRRRV